MPLRLHRPSCFSLTTMTVRSLTRFVGTVCTGGRGGLSWLNLVMTESMEPVTMREVHAILS